MRDRGWHGWRDADLRPFDPEPVEEIGEEAPVLIVADQRNRLDRERCAERLQRFLDDGAQIADEFDRLFGEVDLAAEERDAGAITLGLADQLERVPCRALGAAEYADDQMAGIVRGKLLHRAGAVVLQLQE